MPFACCTVLRINIIVREVVVVVVVVVLMVEINK